MSSITQRLRALLLVIGYSLGGNLIAEPLPQSELIITPSGEIRLTADSVPLTNITESIHAARGIEFTVSDNLAQAIISVQVQADNWQELLRQTFTGFNWVLQLSDNGTQQIFILERTDEVAARLPADTYDDTEEPIDELALDAEDSLFAIGRSLTGPLSIPERLAAYPEHVLQAIELDYAALQQLQPGDVITLKLPSGEQYATFVESERDDDSGVSSWTGYIGDEEAAFDVIITHGEDGLFAHINTPDGLQTIETINGQQWWIDVANSGLDHPDAINDTFQLPTTPSIVTTAGLIETTPLIADQGKMSRNKARSALNKWKKRKRIWTKRSIKHKKKYRVWKKRYRAWKKRNLRSKAHKAKRVFRVHHKKFRQYNRLVRIANRKIRSFSKIAKNKSQGRKTRIDLMVAYTRGVKRSRARHLVALANNAFNNSGVKVRLKVVKMKRVRYTRNNSNNTALQHLTYSKKGLRKIQRLRKRHNADLVTLVRPFKYPAQDSCGIAWLGGANGSNFHPITGFSVVSDGANNGYYCSDYTLVHEIGHNLGSAHDRAHAGAAGAYSYSYGFGESGKAGSIMSYINPEVGRFSSPGYKCKGIRCGAGNANNVRSMNRSRKTVSRYQ